MNSCKLTDFSNFYRNELEEHRRQCVQEGNFLEAEQTQAKIDEHKVLMSSQQIDTLYSR